MSTTVKLFSTDAKAYGDKYDEHLLKQYKLYVEMADKISERRQSANTYFLSINSLLVTFYGILAGFGNIPQQKTWQYFVPAAGLLLCVTWATLIRSYRQLNTGKFEIIHLLETRLPASVYKAEWDLLEKGEGSEYLPFTHVERYVPWIFAGLYVLLMLFSVLNAFGF